MHAPSGECGRVAARGTPLSSKFLDLAHNLGDGCLAAVERVAQTASTAVSQKAEKITSLGEAIQMWRRRRQRVLPRERSTALSVLIGRFRRNSVGRGKRVRASRIGQFGNARVRGITFRHFRKDRRRNRAMVRFFLGRFCQGTHSLPRKVSIGDLLRSGAGKSEEPPPNQAGREIPKQDFRSRCVSK